MNHIKVIPIPRISVKTFGMDFNNISNLPNLLRIYILSLRKSHLKSLRDKCKEFLENHRDDPVFMWLKLAVDLVETKLYRRNEDKPKRKAPKYRLNLTFTSKAFDFINLPKILRSADVKEQRPANVQEDETPMVVFKLSQPIRSQIFNYTAFVSQLKLRDFVTNPDTVPCKCNNFNPMFINDHHQHIMTGDLDIVDNVILKELIRKGPKYREPCTIKFDDALDEIREQLVVYIDDYCIKNKNVQKVVFEPWKNKIISCVEEKINSVKMSKTFPERTSLLKEDTVKKKLRELHDAFVFFLWTKWPIM